MLVPETASHLNYFLQSRKDEIWFARKVRYVKPVAEPHRVNEPAHCDLRCGVLRSDLAHVFRAALRCEWVSQTARSSGRSEMSFKRFPFTMIFSASSESDNSNSLTVYSNSGSAK
jgi:hypothetical protein